MGSTVKTGEPCCFLGSNNFEMISSDLACLNTLWEDRSMNYPN